MINAQIVSALNNYSHAQDLSGSNIHDNLAGDLPDWSEIYCINKVDTQILFNGVSLDGWEIIDFTGHGNISITDSCIIINKGLGISGIKWTKDFPKTNYEVSLEAKRVEGEDFFCGLTFPVKESFCTFVIGGWGGSIVGLSSIDDEDAANNITYDFRNFVLNKWYKIRVKVTDEKIEAWIDKDKIVDFTIEYHKISLRWEAESSKPLGIVTWQTTGAVRNIKLY
jgi:hypothetical protein